MNLAVSSYSPAFYVQNKIRPRRKNCRMTGIYEASKKRGFTDCSTEMFNVDYIEPGQPKKAPFVLRTDDQLSMFFKSESKCILLRVIQ